MGHALIVEVMDHASATLTWRERYVLGVLAQEADDETRECAPGYDAESEDSARFKARVRCSRSQYFETMKALVEKGAIEPVRRGQRQGSARFRIARMAPGVQHPGLRDAEALRSQGPGLQDIQRPGFQDPERLQRPETQDPESEPQHPGFQDTGVRFDPISVSRFTGPLVGGSSSPEKSSSSSSPRECARTAGVKEEEEEEFIAWIYKHHAPRSGEWWRKLAANGDLTTLAEAWRATAARGQRAAMPECGDCAAPIVGPVAADGLCADCRTAAAARPAPDEDHQRAQNLLRSVPPKDLTDALARARAEGLTDARAQETRAVELLYATYDGEPAPDWPPPEVEP